MLVPALFIIITVLGIVIVYSYIIRPRMNPLNRADNFLRQDMVDEALVEYKKILDEDPSNFIVHYKLANIYFGKDEIDQGVLHLEEIISINKYNYEVEKTAVQRKLAEAYLSRNNIAGAFQLYFDILNTLPGDAEALFHVSFISLGQENFDLAQKHFDRLMKVSDKSFELLFGAGIANYQNHKTSEAIEYFRDALAIDPHSDIANLATAFALQRKRDFKTGLNYAKMIVDNSKDMNALFIARRLMAILYVQLKRSSDAVKILEELLLFARKNEMNDEVAVLLYDLGFACLSAEMTEQAYEYWNQLYQHNRNYKNVQTLTTMLRREMDTTKKPGVQEPAGSVIDFADDWIKETFPENFIWRICGLRSEQKIDLNKIMVTARLDSSREKGEASYVKSGVDDTLALFNEMDVESFRIISNRVVGKLGYKVDEILPTYRESDGVDFLAHSLTDREKTIVWVRRWKDARVGEIPLRNLAQAVNDAKAKKGLFITSSELTQSGEVALKRLSKIKVIQPDELGTQLLGLV